MAKRWYQSKTIWTNLLAAIAYFVQNQYGYVVAPEIQLVILALLNGLLRFQTDKPIKL